MGRAKEPKLVCELVSSPKPRLWLQVEGVASSRQQLAAAGLQRGFGVQEIVAPSKGLALDDYLGHNPSCSVIAAGPRTTWALLKKTSQDWESYFYSVDTP